MNNYFTFLRSATSFPELSGNDKLVCSEGLTAAKARDECTNWNASRTQEQKDNGTMMEYAEEGWGSNLVPWGEWDESLLDQEE